MSRLRITGGTIVDPAANLEQPSDLYVADGIVLAHGEAPDGFSADQVIDATGKLVAPGLVDIAARLREPGSTSKGGIISESQAAAAGGITTLLQPPDTQPITDTPSVVELIHSRCNEAAATRILPVGALTKGLKGEQLSEMAALRDAGCPALADGGRPLHNTLVLQRALDYAATFAIPVMLTPEDPYLAAGGATHEGAIANRLGLAGQSTATETAALGRLIAIAEERGVAIHVGRLSSARGAEMVAAAQQRGLPITADTAIHQLYLTEHDCAGYNSLAHTCPPARTTGDREVLRQLVSTGVIGCLCSDHQPHDPDAKAGTFDACEPGISSLDTFLALTLRLVDEGLLTLKQAFERITSGPAKALGLNVGSLQMGSPADICIIDPKLAWQIKPETMHSRGKNTPFANWELTGAATTTIVDGRVVYRRPSD
ncbi:dihydroorotase [Halorhodospira halochloris]|uniref:dihydroorotase n=1 Tax=Halorhodospira halochloris TaxID=1052 RepID=UPI001EE84A69|nr:dihydroorotase [Halorhodospira halochloris]MCG5547410.1 dihydroorotase [Halorhodospira halochloris]